MSEVNVSREALVKVKETLNNFKTDIEYIPSSLIQSVESTKNECEDKIGELVKQINGLIIKIKENETKLSELNNIVACNQRELNSIDSMIINLSGQKKDAEHKLQCLQNEIGYFQNQLSRASSDEEKQKIEDQISDINYRIKRQKNNLFEIDNTIREKTEEKDMLSKQNKTLKNEICRVEAENDRLKKEKTRKENILDRMKATFNNLSNELDNLTTSVKRFANNTLDTMGNSIAGIDQCIQYVDDYMMIKL